MNFTFSRLPIFLWLLLISCTTHASQESLQSTQEETKTLELQAFEEELTRLGNAKSEENKTAYLKTLLTTEESSFVNDLAGINAATAGAWLRLFCGFLYVLDATKNIANDNETKYLLLNALVFSLESSLALWLYNKTVTEAGGSNDFKQLIVGVGGTPGVLLYGLLSKFLPSKKGGLTSVIRAFDARSRDFPAWAQDMLSEISDNFAMMNHEEKRHTEQELLAEIQRHQALGFKEKEHAEHENETHETKSNELEIKAN